MPILSNHWSEGNFMTPGVHHVYVKGVKFITYNSGNRGIEYTLRNQRAQEIRQAFPLVEKALWKLAMFVSALGRTKEECAKFDTENLGCHEQLIGMRCVVEVEKVSGKDGKEYSECTSWWKIDPNAPAEAGHAEGAPHAPAASERAIMDEESPAPDADDIPF